MRDKAYAKGDKRQSAQPASPHPGAMQRLLSLFDSLRLAVPVILGVLVCQLLGQPVPLARSLGSGAGGCNRVKCSPSWCSHLPLLLLI